MKIKLAKALKMKNRLKGEVARLGNIFRRENSRLEESNSTVNCEDVEKEYKETIEKLISLKTKISIANVDLYENICRLEELKSLKTFYEGLNVTDGMVKNMYDREAAPDVYKAYINQERKDNLSKELQKEIDKVQDEIDEFNATVCIEFEE